MSLDRGALGCSQGRRRLRSEVRWKASLKEVIVGSAGLKVAGEKARVGLFFCEAAKS